MQGRVSAVWRYGCWWSSRTCWSTWHHEQNSFLWRKREHKNKNTKYVFKHLTNAERTHPAPNSKENNIIVQFIPKEDHTPCKWPSNKNHFSLQLRFMIHILSYSRSCGVFTHHPKMEKQDITYSTFSIDMPMTSCKSPVKVECTNGLDVTVACPMKEHPLINVHSTFYLSQLGLFP